MTFQFIILSLFTMTLHPDQPTMQVWTAAWHNSEVQTLTELYAVNAAVFPPKKPTLIGNETIVNYFKGGFGKVDVYFEPNMLEVGERFAYEFGEFRDVE